MKEKTKKTVSFDKKEISSIILSTIKDGVDLVDEDLNIIFMNKRFLDIFGKKSIGKKCYAVYRKNKKQCPDCPLKKPIRAGETRTHVVEGVVGGLTFEVTHTCVRLSDGRKAILEVFKDITEQKRNQALLQESEERYRSLFERASDAIMIISRGVFVGCNKKTLELFGMHSKDEIIGLHPYNLSPRTQPDGKNSKETEKKLVAEGLRKGQISFEWTHKTKQGKLFDAEVRLTTFKIGKRSFVEAIVRDVSEQKKAELELKHKEQQLEAAFENSPLPTFMIDRSHKVTVWNKALEELTGVDRKKVIGTKEAWKGFYRKRRPVLADLAIEGDKKSVFTYYKGTDIKESKESPGVFQITSELLLKGDQRIIFFTSSPIKGMDGKNDLAVETLLDLTDSKESEEKLKESEEKFRDLFENANDIIQSVDSTGNFVFVNKKWKQVLGYSDEEIKNLSLKDIIRKDHLKMCIGLFKRVVLGEKLDRVETVFITKKGKEVYVSGSASPYFKDKKFVATRTIFRDITERKKAEEKLKEQMKLLTDFKDATVDLGLGMEHLEKENQRLKEEISSLKISKQNKPKS